MGEDDNVRLPASRSTPEAGPVIDNPHETSQATYWQKLHRGMPVSTHPVNSVGWGKDADIVSTCGRERARKPSDEGLTPTNVRPPQVGGGDENPHRADGSPGMAG